MYLSVAVAGHKYCTSSWVQGTTED